MPNVRNTWRVARAEGTPVSRVAARTIRLRLERVWAEARAAAGDSQDVESIHRLRVASRRTLAAMRAFRELLPTRRRQWFEKKLRRLRRVAGDARDLDVLAGRLAMAQASMNAAHRARSRLVSMLSRQRATSRQPIRELYEELLAADWPGRVDGLVERISDDGADTSFGCYARRCFRPIVVKFFARADRGFHDARQMHRLRIEGKKLRYAMEIFAGVFPNRVRVRCQHALEQLQETLGEFTDHAAAAERFRRWARDDSMTADRGTLSAMRRREDALAKTARKAFIKWWNPMRRRSLRRAFERTLRQESA